MKAFDPRRYQLAEKNYIRNTRKHPTDLPTPEPLIIFETLTWAEPTPDTIIRSFTVILPETINLEELEQKLNTHFKCKINWFFDPIGFLVTMNKREKRKWGYVMSTTKKLILGLLNE